MKRYAIYNQNYDKMYLFFATDSENIVKEKMKSVARKHPKEKLKLITINC